MRFTAEDSFEFEEECDGAIASLFMPIADVKPYSKPPLSMC